MQLHEVPHIKIYVDLSTKEVTSRDFNNYFRTFKSPNETLAHDCIYSPYLEEETYLLTDDYITRTEILKELLARFEGIYINAYFAYDFRNAPVNLNYETNKEFNYIGKILTDTVEGTNLSLWFMVSHFRQFTDKAGTCLKPEHFHCIFGDDEGNGYDKAAAIMEAKRLADMLSRNKLFVIRTIT
jgi:hypothetical protein